MSTQLYALGGLGRIGMNCLAIEAEDQIILVDCGMRMGAQELGVGTIEPDLSWLDRQKSKFIGVLLTHGHEDHLGALPRLLRTHHNVPVWAPPYALAYLRSKLKDDPIDVTPTLSELQVGGQIQVGPFTARSIRVTHSTADATALLIGTPDGRVLHTGDFKIDDEPVDGAHFDRSAFEAIGKDGLDVLLSDSTNAMTQGWTATEGSLKDPLATLITEAPGRVMVSVFASNTHRLATLFQIANQEDRLVCLLGRSVRRHVEVAQGTGHLPNVAGRLVRPAEAMRLPRQRILFIATGSQGEGNAALSRILRNEHPAYFEPNDRLILSARVIPGNHKRVYQLVNGFTEQGVEVFFPPFAQSIHASGHAYRDELRWMLTATQPRHFVPVHGTRVHMEAHAALAREAGDAHVHVVQNGDSLILEAGELRRGESFDFREISHGASGQPVANEVIRERGRLARNGVCAIRGVGNDIVVDEVGTGATESELQALEQILRGLRDPDDVVVLQHARRFFKKAFGIRPEIILL